MEQNHKTLKIQEYLQEHSLEQLESAFGIKYRLHPALPLVIFNYDQLKSPKTEPLVKEARGLVLEEGTWKVVAKGFDRFFNYEETTAYKDFEWLNCLATEKIDGSYVQLFYYKDSWHCSTRLTFGQTELANYKGTWGELILNTLHRQTNPAALRPDYTYVCEFVSPYNKIVQTHKEPKLYLLSTFRNGHEFSWDNTCFQAGTCGFEIPRTYYFPSIEAVQRFLQKKEKEDQTYEGVVLRDKNNLRMKVKTTSYVSLHRLKGNNGCNLTSLDYLVPLALHQDENAFGVLDIFPEIKKDLYNIKNRIETEYIHLRLAWEQAKNLPDQKSFALFVKDVTPLAPILFTMRKKYGTTGTLRDLRYEFEGNADLIIKRIFNDHTK